VLFGGMAYTIYMIHVPLIVLFDYVGFPIEHSVLRKVAVMLGTWSLASLLTTLVERRGIAIGKWLLSIGQARRTPRSAQT
jgi:peptidoglycan/LPS O-acetylase OafA/YrhL